MLDVSWTVRTINRKRVPEASEGEVLKIKPVDPSGSAAKPDGGGPPATNSHFYAVLVTSSLRAKPRRVHIRHPILFVAPLSIDVLPRSSFLYLARGSFPDILLHFTTPGALRNRWSQIPCLWNNKDYHWLEDVDGLTGITYGAGSHMTRHVVCIGCLFCTAAAGILIILMRLLCRELL